MKLGLLIIDMQQTFIENPKFEKTLTPALEYINEASGLFRDHHLPVVVIQDNEAAKGPDSPGFENIHSLVVESSDIRLYKDYSNAFWQTDLDDKLKALGVEFLVIAGFAAEYCVLFTLNGAQERGYGASLLQHGIAGVDETIVNHTQQIRPVISLEALDYIIRKGS